MYAYAMNYRILLVVLFFCCTRIAHGQFEVSFSKSQEVILDELKPAYKAGTTYLLSLGASDRDDMERSAWAFTLGYANFTPKRDTLYSRYTDDDGRDVVGYSSYSDYKVYQFTTSGRWDYMLSPHFEFFYGFEIGYHHTVYKYETYDGSNSDDGDVTESRFALVPQIGIGIPVYRFCFFVQSRYAMSVGSGSRDDGKDVFNHSWSNGFGVRFRLENLRKNKDEKKTREPAITYDSIFLE
jgi:hypothetical protein